MHRVIRIALLLILASVFSGGAATGQQASPSPQKSNPAPTPIPLAKIPLAAESDIASLQEIDATVSRERSSANIITGSLSNLTNEIGARVAEDTRLLTASPSLDLLYRLNTTWKDFNDDLSALGRELTESATTLENALARLDQLSKSWQATLEFAVKRPDTPPPVMQRLQSLVDSIERTRQAAESDRVQELTLQSSLSEAQARVQTALSSVEQSQNRALKNLLVRDSPPIWNRETNVRREWAKQSGASFSSQIDASTAFVKRLPFSLLIHAFLIAALNANLAIGSLNISMGQILAFLIAVWAAFLFSKFLRFLLEEDVYHYFHLARGVPYAISTTLHYIILLLGFFIALGALGIDLTKITILAGAFSVGVGFGLQNVINNFVSGLILLFERPIKIGDVIEVSGNVGEVRRIGIRASVIRTADGAEVIVPNGSLISSQVTNWTFSDRERAVEVSVSVVGGADPQRVIESLKSTAAAQPGVAKDPSPQVYVVNFSAAAVTFQLRAWTDRYQDWAQLRSDLSVAVNETLAREKITIA